MHDDGARAFAGPEGLAQWLSEMRLGGARPLQEVALMFTDNPTTPAQLEVLLDVVHTMRQRKANAEGLRQLIQPKGLPGLTDNSRQFAHHLSAAEELGLVQADENKDIRLTYTVRGEHQPRKAILAAFDRVALADARVEKWAGRFYAYLIVREEAPTRTTGEVDLLANRFMSDLAPTVDKGNPMNLDKYRALMRWYPYVGLGWLDPAEVFVPDPTERLRRSLPNDLGQRPETGGRRVPRTFRTSVSGTG